LACVTKAYKSKICSVHCWRPRDADGVVPVLRQSAEEFSCLDEAGLFVLLRPSINWMKTTDNMKGICFIQKSLMQMSVSSQTSQKYKNVLANIWVPCGQPSKLTKSVFKSTPGSCAIEEKWSLTLLAVFLHHPELSKFNALAGKGKMYRLLGFEGVSSKVQALQMWWY
jgi:hypothetical protein